MVRRIRQGLVPLAFALALSPVGVATAFPNHSSGNVTNNSCTWRGYHNYYQVDQYGSGANSSTQNMSGCLEVSVRMHYDVFYSTLTFAPYFASQAREWYGLPSEFHWSDHNANPLGSPPWVGFRMY